MEASGYDSALVLDHEMKEDFICVICAGLCVEPRVLPCTHHFCNRCITRWLWASVNKSCPLCRAAVPTQSVLPLHRFEQFVYDSIQLACPRRNQGCHEVLRPSTVEQHEAECSYKIVACINRCGFGGPRADMAAHFAVCGNAVNRIEYLMMCFDCRFWVDNYGGRPEHCDFQHRVTRMIQMPAHQLVIVTDPRAPQSPAQVEGEAAAAVVEEETGAEAASGSSE